MMPSLTARERDAMLRRLGVPAAPASGLLLARLQRGWCLTQPFHNLDLLAGWVTGRAPLGPEEAIERCVRGLGGPCHVHAAGFLALLRSLGFDAELAAATIGHPGDHLGVRVIVDGAVFWTDVGNGQPYLQPFASDRPMDQAHLGWQVRSTPTEGGVLVERTSPDQPAWRRVYVADPERIQAWSDFAAIIDRHHREPGFGPFLTGLRAVRITESRMTTVRDDVVTEYRADGFTRRPVAVDQLASLIGEGLGLADLPVREAVEAWLGARRAA